MQTISLSADLVHVTLSKFWVQYTPTLSYDLEAKQYEFGDRLSKALDGVGGDVDPHPRRHPRPHAAETQRERHPVDAYQLIFLARIIHKVSKVAM